MSYERSVSAPSHELSPETVWHMQMPQIRFGRNATDELAFQLRDLGVDEDAHGLVITDGNLADIGHVGRVETHLTDAELAVDVYDESKREPSVSDIENCLEFVRDEKGGEGYDFYVGLGGGSCMDTAKTTRAVIANGGSPLDYIAEPTGEGQALTESGPPLVLLPTTAGTGAEISPSPSSRWRKRISRRGFPAITSAPTRRCSTRRLRLRSRRS